MASKIPEEVIEQIRSQSDIVDVVSEYMQLTKRGRNYFGLCPFHGEQTPSFSVSTDKQIFHCFGCGAGGNAFTFVMDIEGITFPEAVAKLGERAGLAVEAPTVTAKPVSATETRMKEAHEFVASFFHHILMNTEDGEHALQYLKDRGFSEEMIIDYQLGYALPNFDTLTILLERQGFDIQEMAACGLLVERDDGSYFDRFRERVMFPIRDDRGKVIAFSGRVLVTNKEEAKYLNSPESPIFHKSEVLYNVDRARPAIRKQRRAVLMEGFMDVLAATTAGVTNAVATMGTSLTDQHCHKLKRLADNITLCYDGDQAGLDAAKRAGALLQQMNLAVEVAILPDGLDPDDYIKTRGKENFAENIIEHPQAYLAFIMHYARKNKNFQHENDVLQYVREVLEELAKRHSPMERDLYIRQLAQETGISEEAIYADYRKLEQQTKTIVQPTQTVNIPTNTKVLSHYERAERLLLAHMLADADIVHHVLLQENDAAPFIRDVYNTVFIYLIRFYEEYQHADVQRFTEILPEQDLRKIVAEAALMECNEDSRTEEVNDCLASLKKARIQHSIDEKEHKLKEMIKLQETAEANKLAMEIIHLQRVLRGM